MKRVNIKGRVYRIISKPHPDAATELNQPEEKLDGYCDSEGAEIYLNPNLDREFYQTLIHEMIHGCLYEVGVELSPELEEVVAESVSIMIDQNFKISPKGKK